MPSLSVIIPTLDEADRLPVLLGQLAAQTRPADEVIVADAGSADRTREMAREHGAQVVEGGRPAAGRNAGAQAASGDLLLFLDADVDLDEDFMHSVLDEFDQRSLDVATAHVAPLEPGVENEFACEVVNLYLDLMQYVVPHAPGFCILVRRVLHEQIGGFDETLALAEDHDYVQRAARRGKFRVLQTTAVRTSMRRIEKEGLVRLAFKYLYSELYVLSGRPMHDVPFEYEFAAFDKEPAGTRFSRDVLRDRLGEVAETARTLPFDVFDDLRRLGGRESLRPEQVDRILHGLPIDDLARLRTYVRARMRLARMRQGAALRRVRTAGDAVWNELAGPAERE